MLGLALLRPSRCALLSTAAAAESSSFEYLALSNDRRLLPRPVVARRVLEYLQSNSKRALADESQPQSPLPHKTVVAPNTVELLTPLVRWGFQQLATQSELQQEAADAVFSALQPHVNMARGVVWRQYFQRQFFLSEAPLRAYLQALKIHQDALPIKFRANVEEFDEEDEDAEQDEQENDDEVAVVVATKETGRRPSYLSKQNAAFILADNKEWEWVPLHLTLSIVLDFCFRGRFEEAIEAYTSLPLTDSMRQKVVQVLEEFEQFPSVLYLYEVHRSLGGAVHALDVASELNALKKMGRVDEMDSRFQNLPTKEQSRADIQVLMGN